MNLFIDSSFLLSIIFEEEGSDECYEIWNSGKVRLGSILLSIESMNSIRRAFGFVKEKKVTSILKEKEQFCEVMLSEVSLRNIDSTIYEIIKYKKEISGCRSLDAIHIATALDFKRNSLSEIHICSTDKRLRDVAKKVGFSVLPKKIVVN